MKNDICSNNTGNRQLGMSIWSWLYVLGTLGLMLMIGVKCIPVYMNNYDIRSTLIWATNQTELHKSSAYEIQKRIQRRFDSGYVENVKGRDVKVTRTKDGRKLQVKYEVRKPLFYNMELLFDFDESALIPKKE